MQKAIRTWLITGADKGLGFQATRAALEQGDRVVVTVLDRDGGHSLSAHYGDRLRAFHLDAKDHGRFDDIVARAVAAFGRIDVLVNNAGYGVLAMAEETSAEQYRPLFEVNFFGLVEMTRAVLPIMRGQRSGHIINLSSLAGFAASPGFGLYCASKFAVEGYSEALAKEVGHLGIRVTIVEPGGFRSDFAGPSLVSRPSAIADYADMGRRIDDYTATRHGTQPNDPKRFGAAMCRLVDIPDPPLRLPLGTDAVQLVRDKVQFVTQELERWSELSHSTAVEV